MTPENPPIQNGPVIVTPVPTEPVAPPVNHPRFLIRCQKCRWATINNGTSEALKGLNEMPNSCQNCGKPREFRCPECGRASKMTRIKGA